MPCHLITVGTDRLSGSGTFSDVLNIATTRTLLVKRGIFVANHHETAVAHECAGDPATLDQFALAADVADTLHAATLLT